VHFGLLQKHEFSTKARKFAPIYRGTHEAAKPIREGLESGAGEQERKGKVMLKIKM
jgi:hypothetical protein